MLVKCDKCGQSYEVNDSRLSPQGARIKCPSCANIFLVRLESAEKRLESTGNMKAPTPSKAAKEKVADVAGEAETASENEVTWKVRHMGLTYTFHDLTSLQDWLSGRPTLDDVKVAKDEDDWKELGDYADVLTTELITKFFPLGDVPKSGVVPSDNVKLGTLSGTQSPLRGQAAMGNGNLPLMSASTFSPVTVSSDLSVTDDAQSAKKRRIEAKRRAEAEKANKKKWRNYIILIVVVLVLVIAGICFVRYGGMDLIMGNETEPQAQEVVPSEPKPPIEKDLDQIQKTDPDVIAAKAADSNADTSDMPKLLSEEEIAKLEEESIRKQFEEAEQMVNQKKWPEARATLESLIKERPNDVAALQLLAKTYRGLNLNSQAAEVEAKIKKIKSAPNNTIDFDE